MFYLDTEFNSFEGDLMSIALAPADDTLPYFYRVVEGNWQKSGELHEWVAFHVSPHLFTYGGETVAVPRETAARDLSRYLTEMFQRTGEVPTIVADWPTDFAHLLELFIIGPGKMVGVPDFNMAYRSLKGFNTADHSKLPHNALADAEAMRDYCEA